MRGKWNVTFEEKKRGRRDLGSQVGEKQEQIGRDWQDSYLSVALATLLVSPAMGWLKKEDC